MRRHMEQTAAWNRARADLQWNMSITGVKKKCLLPKATEIDPKNYLSKVKLAKKSKNMPSFKIS